MVLWFFTAGWVALYRHDPIPTSGPTSPRSIQCFHIRTGSAFNSVGTPTSGLGTLKKGMPPNQVHSCQNILILFLKWNIRKSIRRISADKKVRIIFLYFCSFHPHLHPWMLYWTVHRCRLTLFLVPSWLSPHSTLSMCMCAFSLSVSHAHPHAQMHHSASGHRIPCPVLFQIVLIHPRRGWNIVELWKVDHLPNLPLNYLLRQLLEWQYYQYMCVWPYLEYHSGWHVSPSDLAQPSSVGCGSELEGNWCNFVKT